MSSVFACKASDRSQIMKMRKIATVFVIAVLVPTLGLAWLAMRSIRHQEIVANNQRAILHQSSAEALAGDLNNFMDDVRVFYRQLVGELIAEQGADDLSRNFDRIAPARWSQCSVACVVTEEGRILCPSPMTKRPEARAFLDRNASFLVNESPARFYEASPVVGTGPVVAENRVYSTFSRPEASAETEDATDPFDSFSSATRQRDRQSGAADKKAGNGNSQLKVEVAEERLQNNNPFRRLSQSRKSAGAPPQVEADSPTAQESIAPSFDRAAPILRNVSPSQQAFGEGSGGDVSAEWENYSRLEWGVGNLREIVGDKSEGALSRFLGNGLNVLLWNRHSDAPGRIFWAELDLDEIRRDLSGIVTGYRSHPGICLALLDGQGKVVAKTSPGFETDWSRPFVASEVGQILPHWEVAAYLLNPETVNQSARTARLTIWLLVPTLLGAIAVGTFLIFRSIEMEMRLARQKTDFVSNVSHELRTPLTSIRMFSELLSANGASEKDREYSGIISREAGRLTRLINNLLDFSRLERGSNPYRQDPIALEALTRETVETYRMQLEAEGCRLTCECAPGATPVVRGDRDALSQVLLNLLSNAEKYGAPGGRIEVRLLVHPDESFAEWQVIDQGAGIDRKHAARIFDKFYRADDSLSSTVQGSGLGLTLARQIVIHHGGRISFRNLPGGGSCFSVFLPLEDPSVKAS